MASVQAGLYLISKDTSIKELLSPEDSAATFSTITDIPSLLGNLGTEDTCVWKLEKVGQGTGSTNTFVIYTGIDTALTYDDTTMTIYLDTLNKSNNYQQWDIRQTGVVSNSVRAGLKVSIKNKFDRSVTMGVDTSGSAAPMPPSPAHKWVLVNLATPDSSTINTDSDMEENRDWLRDMLWYFSRRYPQASNQIGFYPFTDSHIKYPNKRLPGSRF